MSSTNEELPSQPKPRASPLDFRNTDLVSRLLAATPPYLYNMPIVPNSFFFSEMLRSFVQAKSDNANRLPGSNHHRRPRKRSWTQARTEYYHRDSKSPKPDINLNDWTTKAISPERLTYDNKRTERPLELTMGKVPLNNNTKINESDVKMMSIPSASSHYSMEKQEIPSINQSNHMPLMFPILPQNMNQEPTHPNLMLPPPPPIWYPPLYPPPYGFDPLHFFIDLRVSGHIYDRKNGKDNVNNANMNNPSVSVPHTNTQPEEMPPAPTDNKFHLETNNDGGFKQSRHKSAFSVPMPTPAKNIPMNLSSNKLNSSESDGRESKSLKFDVKSMGFETTYNKTSTNYIMNNIGKIYKDMSDCKIEQIERKYREPLASPDTGKEGMDEKREETEQEREKRVKDLRALIGLELVVDYMNHTKPKRHATSNNSEESSTDIEESMSSPSVEVVACADDL